MATPPNQQPERDRAPSPAAATGNMVSVACKLPHGLILRAQAKQKRRQAHMGGGLEDFEIFEPTGEQAVVKGYLHPQALIVDGAAITQVPRHIWENWFELNKTSDMVVGGFVKGHDRHEFAVGHAKEVARERNGLEPIDPDKPGARLPKTRLVGPAGQGVVELGIERGTTA